MHLTTRAYKAPRVIAGIIASLLPLIAGAAGTPAGTVIENQAVVNFELAGTPLTRSSNVTSLRVAERIDVVASLQSPQLLAAAGDADRALLFTITNTGNGTESYGLAIDNTVGGDDFDPVAAVPAIYFDSDASGDLTAADQPYTAGVNDPVLAADASVDIFLVNSIPVSAANGEIGRTQLTVSSLTGVGAAGTVYAGSGEGGVDAVNGSSTGQALAVGEYIVSDIQLNVVKTQIISDPFGGTEPVPGATITYTITIEVVGSGTATGATFRDEIPTYSSYLADSISLNGGALSDLADADAGEYDTTAVPSIVVRLGDLTLADGVQTIEFQVSID